MSRSYRTQGLLFSACALATVVACLLLPRLDRVTEIVTVAGFVVLLGVPHGALDALFARRLCGANSAGRWIGFSLAYGLAAFAVIGVWAAAPAIFLVGFLVVSAAHFSGDPAAGTLPPSRLLYGGAIIVLPTLSHASEVGTLFAMLAGQQAAGWLTPTFAAFALPWFLALLGCALVEARRDAVTGIELAAVGLLAVAAPPLVAFGVFFCAMHGARHILRTAAYASDLRPRLLVAVGVAPMVIVLGAATACWFLLAHVEPDSRIMQILFVGLAALTVPHMLLVERVRLSGWATPA